MHAEIIKSSKRISRTATLPLQQSSPFLSLPVELQLLIIPNLPYPDALALKHTHPQFYNIVDTSVRLKVAWLLDRKSRKLSSPQEKCVMKTDTAFCTSGGGQVRRIMENRRAHGECAAGEGGCEVVLGASCGGSKSRLGDSVVGKLWKEHMGRLDVSVAMWVLGLLMMSFVVNLWFLLRQYSKSE